MRPENLSWQNALQRLKVGNANFVKNHLDEKSRTTISDKNPFTIILSCSDCHAGPEIIFNTTIGEAVVIRVAGNIASSSSIASIEQAVMQLGVNLIIVLGHENCAAVSSAIVGEDNGFHLNQLLAHILPAISISNDQSVNAVAKVHTNLTTAALTERSTLIREARNEDGLKIIPAFYHQETGKVNFL